MSITFLGLPNIARRGSCVITAMGPEPFVDEALLLKNEDPRHTARILTLDPLYSRWLVTTEGDTFEMGGAALVNVKLSDNGYFRIVEDSSSYAIVLTPNTIISSANVSGVVGDVDEPISTPDASCLSPTATNLSWELILGFSLDGATARTGAAMGCIVLNTLTFGDCIDIYPTIKVELRDNGVVKQEMGWKAVTATSGLNQIFLYAFDPTTLGDPTLANVEVRIIGYPGDNGSYFGLDCAAAYYDDSGAPNLFDSGFVSGDQSYYVSFRDGLLPPKSVHHTNFVVNGQQERFTLQILDDGAQVNPPIAVLSPPPLSDSVLKRALSLTPQPYTELGSLIFGPKIVVEPGIQAESGNPKIEIKGEAPGGLVGQVYSADIFRKRGMPSGLELICTRDAMMDLMAKIGWQKGTSGLFYVISDNDLELKHQLFNAFPCICTKIIANPLDGIGRKVGTDRGKDMFIVSMELEER